MSRYLISMIISCVLRDAQGSTPVLPEHIHYEKSYYSYIALMSICCREEAELRPAAQEIVNTLVVLSKQLTQSSSHDHNKIDDRSVE